jgi:hypothetical protein
MKKELTIRRKKFLVAAEIPDNQIDENSLILEQIIANFITAIQKVFLKNALRARAIVFVVLVITALLATPIVLSFGNGLPNSTARVLAPAASSTYSENLSLYMTSSEVFWRVGLAGGNITVSSVSVPSSVSTYTITLTHYAKWKSQYEVFTKFGFGLLGSTEPYADGAVLQINGTSRSDAVQLANSLSQHFGLVFQPLSSKISSDFSFFSPSSYQDEVHVFFYPLIPQSANGFASMFPESQLEANDLDYFRLSYSASSTTYSLSYGGLSALTSATSFTLYTQLGLSGTSYNYSSAASSSTIQLHILGGLVSSSNATFVNNYSNLSALISASPPTRGNRSNAVPNINASLDFSFPTILAYRQITPSLTPSRGENVSVTVFVRNVSPAGTTAANNVKFNDSWVYQNKNEVNLTVGQTGKIANLTADSTETIAYGFTVLASNGTIQVPATPITYQFSSAANKTVTATAYLNPETIEIGATNEPLLEASETLPSGTVQAGQTFSVNVSITNKGNGPAINLASGTLTKANLPAGSTWSFLSNASSGGLTSTNSTVSYSVTWHDASGHSLSTTTNTMSAVFSFSSPGTPAAYVQKSVLLAKSSTSANVTLTVFNGSPNEVSNATIQDPVPPGMIFSKGFNTSSIHETGSLVDVNISSLKGSSNETFVYALNISTPDQNILFQPANISAKWNNQTIVHYSGGYGLPLGVKASKVVSPAAGFQGTNVTISLGVVNEGSLPVYAASLNNVNDSFIAVSSSGSVASQAILNTGQSINQTLKGYLTGSQGTYNTTSSTAGFLFAGANQTAISNVTSVTVYGLPTANLTFSGPKIEEDHDILVVESITNPSNVQINNVTFTVIIPKGLTVASGESPIFNIGSISPNQSVTHDFTVRTSQPNQYEIQKGNLTFYYQNHLVRGNSAVTIVSINDDISIRYGIPVVIGLILVIGTILYVRRLTPKQ